MASTPRLPAERRPTAMTTLPLYRVPEWRRTFENAKSRTYAKPQFVCVPNKHGGSGLSNIQGEPDGAAIYGVWMWIVQVCSRHQPEREGYLTADGKKDGRRLGARELANMFRRPIDEIHRAFQVLQSPEVAWLELLDGYPEFLEQTPHGHHADTAIPKVSQLDTKEPPILEGHSADTTRIPAGHRDILSEVTEGKKEQKEILSPAKNGDVKTGTTGMVEGECGDSPVSNDGHMTDTTVSDAPRHSEAATVAQDDVVQHAEAKLILGKLIADRFPDEKPGVVWPNNWDHWLDQALPIGRESLALIDWAYRQPDDHAIFTITMKRHSFGAVIENLRGEASKIRSARKKIGLNGLSSNAECGIRSAEEWTPERKKTALALYGDRELPALFSQMPASARSEIDSKAGEVEA